MRVLSLKTSARECYDIIRTGHFINKNCMNACLVKITSGLYICQINRPVLLIIHYSAIITFSVHIYFHVASSWSWSVEGQSRTERTSCSKSRSIGNGSKYDNKSMLAMDIPHTTTRDETVLGTFRGLRFTVGWPLTDGNIPV